MKMLFFTFTLFLSSSLIFAQQKNSELFQVVDNPAEPAGGYTGFYKFVSKNLRYPAEARRYGIEGKVYVQFVIDETGDLVDDSVKVVKSPHPSLSEEAARVIKSSPNWSAPEMADGRKVKQRIILPITFKLGGKKIQYHNILGKSIVRVEIPEGWQIDKKLAKKSEVDLVITLISQKSAKSKDHLFVNSLDKSSALSDTNELVDFIRNQYSNSFADPLIAQDVIENGEGIPPSILLTIENHPKYPAMGMFIMETDTVFVCYGFAVQNQEQVPFFTQALEQLVATTRLSF